MSLETFAISLLAAVVVTYFFMRWAADNYEIVDDGPSEEMQDDGDDNYRPWADLYFGMIESQVRMAIMLEEMKKCPYCRGTKTHINLCEETVCNGCGAVRDR